MTSLIAMNSITSYGRYKCPLGSQKQHPFDSRPHQVCHLRLIHLSDSANKEQMRSARILNTVFPASGRLKR